MKVFSKTTSLFHRGNWLERTYYNIRWFFRHKIGKWHMNVVKTAFKGEPYDQGYLYELEASKINEMMQYNMKMLRFVGVENVIRNMRICLSLIDIFSEKRDLYHFDGGFDFVESEETDEPEADFRLAP